MEPELTGLSDDDLMRLLGETLDFAEPVPMAAVEAAYAAIDMGSLTEELAMLVFDSQFDDDLVAMRAVETEVRLLSFANDHLTVDLELHGDGRTILGQLTPPTTVPLQLELDDGHVVDVEIDQHGRFRVTAPAGAIRLRATGLMITPWITR